MARNKFLSTNLLVCTLGAVLLLENTIRADEITCIKDFGNATYDLGKLANQVNSPQGRMLIDSRADLPHSAGVNNYTYHFNLCDNLSPEWVKDSKCSPEDGTPAVQIARFPVPAEYECLRLAGKYNGTNAEWKLADNEDPSRGVMLIYRNGQECQGDSNNRKRSFTINLLCAENTRGFLREGKAPVFETETCTYDAIIESASGCPKSCPQDSEGFVCGQNGVCRYNRHKQSPQCYCFPGFEGAGCTEHTSSGGSISGVGVVLILLSILTAACLVFLYLLWSKIRSLRLDMTAYRSLAGEDTLGRRPGYDQSPVTQTQPEPEMTS